MANKKVMGRTALIGVRMIDKLRALGIGEKAAINRLVNLDTAMRKHPDKYQTEGRQFTDIIESGVYSIYSTAEHYEMLGRADAQTLLAITQELRGGGILPNILYTHLRRQDEKAK